MPPLAKASYTRPWQLPPREGNVFNDRQLDALYLQVAYRPCANGRKYSCVVEHRSGTTTCIKQVKYYPYSLREGKALHPTPGYSPLCCSARCYQEMMRDKKAGGQFNPNWAN